MSETKFVLAFFQALQGKGVYHPTYRNLDDEVLRNLGKHLYQTYPELRRQPFSELTIEHMPLDPKRTTPPQIGQVVLTISRGQSVIARVTDWDMVKVAKVSKM